MTAYVVKEPYLAADPDGVQVVVPKGARVEDGNHFLLQNPEMWDEEKPKLFEPRMYTGLTVFPRGEGESPVTVDLSTGKPVDEYTEDQWLAWLAAESEFNRVQAEEAAKKSAPAKSTGGVKRSLPAPKR